MLRRLTIGHPSWPRHSCRTAWHPVGTTGMCVMPAVGGVAHGCCAVGHTSARCPDVAPVRQLRPTARIAANGARRHDGGRTAPAPMSRSAVARGDGSIAT